MSVLSEIVGRYTEEDWTDFAHAGPGTLAGRYLRRFWQPVQRSADLARGQAKPIRIMDEDFTLYRGHSGAPHLVGFRCAHRGTQLSVGFVEGERIRCCYHGWMYDASGQCVEQPGEPRPFADGISIASYPTQEYLGLVFSYLGEGDPPALPRYPSQEREGVHIVNVFGQACNYFQALENDPSHGHYLHSGRDRGVPYPRVDVDETEWGIKWTYHHPDGVEQVTHRGMPNIGHNMGPPKTGESGWREFMSWTLPLDDENTIRFQIELWALSGAAKARFESEYGAWLEDGGSRGSSPELVRAALAGHLTLDELRTRRDIHVTTTEDDIAQVGQGMIADRSSEHLGATDRHVILLRGLWRQDLRALAEGHPLRQWVHSEAIMPTEGSPQRQLLTGRAFVGSR